MKPVTKCLGLFALFCFLNYMSYAQNAQHSCGADSVHNPAITYGSVTDIDGNIYKTVVIGSQIWMAENLKTSRFSNGNSISLISSANDWINTFNTKSPAYCWYNNDSASYNCPYGKLYNWHVVNDSRKVCPLGWHVPTDQEWLQLANFIDPNGGGVNGGSTGGDLLKSTGLRYWVNNSSLLSNNSTGFSAITTGVRLNDGLFVNIGLSAGFWTSTPLLSLTNQVYYNALSNFGTGIIFTYGPKETGICIRCISDSTISTLPLTYQSFKVEKQNDYVKLFWQTANEINNDFFIVQHSTNTITWQNIGNVYAGNGNYNYLHTTPSVGSNYYRLQQVDKDGKASFSSIEQISLNLNQNKEILVYPNPSDSKYFILDLPFFSSGKLQYFITDISGSQFQQGQISTQKTKIDVSVLPSGTYIIKLSNGVSKKIMKF